MAEDGLKKLKVALEALTGSAELALLCSNEGRRVFRTQVQTRHLERLARRYRQLFAETGYWPIASWEHAFLHLEIHGMPTETVVRDVLQRGDSFNVESWFLREQNLWKERLGAGNYEGDLADRHGDWPLENKSWYKWVSAFADPPEGDRWLLFVEVEEAWHVPAVLGVPWFGWPDRPNEPEIHVGMLKHLHRSYGAELRTLATDCFTIETTRGPKTREEAMKLAYWFNLYAPDLIGEIVDSFEQLAVTLMATSNWFFWWD